MEIFTKKPNESVGALGEIALLEKIKKQMQAFPKIAHAAPRGIGDDCAVLPPAQAGTCHDAPEQRLVTTDSLIFGTHFDASVSARNAGAKLIKRNASDIAAMGGVPADAVLALVMSRDVAQAWLEDFYAGACEACESLGIELAGGDIAGTPPPASFFSATLALTGFVKNPLRRDGAKIGDAIFVTGTLGGSIFEKHYAFTPRLAEGQFLAHLPAGTISACIDVTDGLLKDHAAILPAGTHADFDLPVIPISEIARKHGENALEHAFCDGEDYELLFCVVPEFAEKLPTLWKKHFPQTQLTRIGTIAAGTLAPASTAGIAKNAYEHFNLP